jgi:transcriptional regulator with XRE-family HTH domain
MLKIRELRLHKGLTGRQLAEKLHISTQYLYDIERGKRRIHADLLSEIADIFGTSTDYLVGRTNDPSPPSSSPEDRVMVTNPELSELIEETAKLSKDQQELLTGGWKWALDVVRQQYTYKTMTEQPVRVKEGEFKYPPTDEKPAEDDIDVRSTPMAANLEDDTESIPLTPELENLIKDSIKEARKIKREHESRKITNKKKQPRDKKATTDNQ